MNKFEKQSARQNNLPPEIWEKLISRKSNLYSRDDDIRNPFMRDYTRILHSLAYRRLKHKTQVFFNAGGNDHICTRIEHVAHVESVANSIARNLGLNEDLTQAIAMGHDLGHAPFGHEGEEILRELTMEHLGMNFWHEQNGLYFVDKVELLSDNENQKQNLNLTYAVRDGIISHCGEKDQSVIRPRKELFDLKDFSSPGEFEACTWEGCVVKISDTIAYLGRDIEDAITLEYLSEEQIDMLSHMARIRDEKAINTTVIMHNMIIDLCENSSPEEGLKMSDEMAEQMRTIKDFNRKYIYGNSRLVPFRKYAKLILNELYGALKAHCENRLHGNTAKSRYKFMNEFDDWVMLYTEGSSYPNEKIYGDMTSEKKYIRACIDYISGMTDAYAER
ncbi:MAG: HD domain-containing protein [Eubacteriales bacterium]|nr:HD domain-containing protein [Eubacteriales bacterium]